MERNMMDFKEFTKEVKKGLEELADENTEVVVEERLKNNGLKLTGISMLQKGETVSPAISFLMSALIPFSSGNRPYK